MRTSIVWALPRVLTPEIIEGLRMNFTGECTEVGMYLAMARQCSIARAIPRSAEAFKRYALAKRPSMPPSSPSCWARLLTPSTKKNLEMRAEAENGATAGKKALATQAKELGLDAIHDTVHEMCKDEARHGKGFDGLLKRYFG